MGDSGRERTSRRRACWVGLGLGRVQPSAAAERDCRAPDRMTAQLRPVPDCPGLDSSIWSPSSPLAARSSSSHPTPNPSQVPAHACLPLAAHCPCSLPALAPRVSYKRSPPPSTPHSSLGTITSSPADPTSKRSLSCLSSRHYHRSLHPTHPPALDDNTPSRDSAYVHVAR